GDDRLIVRGVAGSGGGPLLRVIGGGGDDELTDSSRAGRTKFYDDRGNNRFVKGPGTSVDTHHYEEPPLDSALGRPRDWGSRWVPLTWFNYSPDLSLFVGAGADGTGYDFRRLPYNSRLRVRGGYATGAQTYRAEFTGEFRGSVPPVIVRLQMRASGIDVLRFYDFGNETPDTGSTDFHKVKQQQYL